MKMAIWRSIRRRASIAEPFGQDLIPKRSNRLKLSLLPHLLIRRNQAPRSTPFLMPFGAASQRPNSTKRFKRKRTRTRRLKVHSFAAFRLASTSVRDIGANTPQMDEAAIQTMDL